MLAALLALALTTGASPVADNAVVYKPNSYAQEQYLRSTAPTRVFSSRVRRGKSYVGCLSEHAKCVALPGIVCAITRLERVSMENTTLDTLKSKIVPQSIWSRGWSESKSVLVYPPVRCDDGVVRQSRIHIFGWLDPSRILSAEFGSIMIDQAEQLDRRHFTFAQTRLSQLDPWIAARAAKLVLGMPQLSLICNPEDSEHWIAQEFDPEAGMRVVRYEDGREKFEVISSGFHDNEENLPPGYHERLESLRGTVYYDRLVLGKWARAEGSVFPMFEVPRHVIAKPASWAKWGGYPPPTWPRYRGIDFGFRNPFVCLWVAESPEGVRYVYRQWAATETLVEDHAKRIVAFEQDELAAMRDGCEHSEAQDLEPYLSSLYVRGSFADHDAEDAATLARHGVATAPARKGIHNAIQSIAGALNRGELFVIEGSNVFTDPREVAEKRPTSLERELSAYRWTKQSETRANPKDDTREMPIDANNHRIDALGYVLYTLDRQIAPSFSEVA